MTISLVRQLTLVDERFVNETTEGFVPEEVIDIHGHLFHTRSFANLVPRSINSQNLLTDP